MDHKSIRHNSEENTINKEILKQLYIIEKKNLSEIGKIFNYSSSTIKNRLVKYNIPLRSRKELGLLKMENLINKKFNRLTILKYLFTKNKTPHWECKCDCGKIIISNSCMLRSGDSQSCGCYNRELSSKIHSGKNNKNWTGYEKISGTFWFSIKESARKRNISFEITIQQAWDIYLKQNGICALSGLNIEFSPNIRTQRALNTASLDRIDSNKDYTINNVQWVHKDVNNMKQYFNEDYFIKICSAICNYKNKENNSDS